MQGLFIRDPHNIHILDYFVSKPLTKPNLWGDVNFLFPVLAVCTTRLVVATTTSPHCYTLHARSHTATKPQKHNSTPCPKYTNTLCTTLCQNTLQRCAPNCHRLGSLRLMRCPSLPHFPYSRVKALPEIQVSHLSSGTGEVYMLRILLSICRRSREKHNRSF